MVTSSQIINSNSCFTIFYSCRIILTANTNSDITCSISRNSDSDSDRFTLLSLANHNINRSIISRSSNLSSSVRCLVSTITGIDYFNFVSSRSYIAIQLNNSSTIDNSSIILLITDFNSHITSSIIANNHNNSTVTLINDLHVRNNFRLINSEVANSVVGSVVVIAFIFNNNRFVTGSQITNRNCSSAVNDFTSVFMAIDCYSHIASSIFRNFNSDCSCFTFCDFCDIDNERSIILRSDNCSIDSGVGVSAVTGVNHFNFVSSRSYITIQLNNSSTINNSSIILLITDFNSHITSSIIANNHNNSTVTLINDLHVRNCLSLADSEVGCCVV